MFRRPIPGAMKTSHSRPGYVNLGSAVKELPISYRRLKSMLESGELKATKKGSCWMIPRSELVRLEQELLQQSARQ